MHSWDACSLEENWVIWCVGCYTPWYMALVSMSDPTWIGILAAFPHQGLRSLWYLEFYLYSYAKETFKFSYVGVLNKTDSWPMSY